MPRDPQRPNILMIMTDQHHAGCVGYAGHPDVKTPNLDQLAGGGVTFKECFVQNGVCTPSRVSYLTGMYPHSHGCYANDTQAIPADLLSLPRYLQQYGYETGLVGKKHLPGWHTHGFQHQRVCYTADGATRENHYYNHLKKHNLHHLYDDTGDVEKFCLTDGPVVPLEHSLEVWTGDESISYLESRSGDAPFVLMTSFERPHPPLTIPDGCPFVYDPDSITLPPNDKENIGDSPFFFNRNVELEWRKSRHGEQVLREALCAYYSLISLIDHEVGRIVETLERLGLRENTLIVFCADHGDFAGEYSRMAKGWNYDCIHRIPFFWNWPGGDLRNGAVRSGLVETIDIFPTLCNLLDISTPKSVQGQDITPLLREDCDSERDAVFYEFICAKTVRTRTHKLTYGMDGTKQVGELFDLVNDPHEYVNLFDAPEAAGVRDDLLRKLLDWWMTTQQPHQFSTNNEHLPPTRWLTSPE